MPFYYDRPSISPVIAGLFAAGVIKKRYAVLDAGCGRGIDCLTLASWGIRRVVGIDNDERDILEAEARLRRLRRRRVFRNRIVRFHPGTLTQRHGCFRDRSFDVVLATLLFNNLKGAGVALSFQEVARVLKPHGLFVMQDRTSAPRFGARHLRVILPPTFHRYFVASRSVATFLVEYTKKPGKRPGASKRVLVSIVVARRRARKRGDGV